MRMYSNHSPTTSLVATISPPNELEIFSWKPMSRSFLPLFLVMAVTLLAPRFAAAQGLGLTRPGAPTETESSTNKSDQGASPGQASTTNQVDKIVTNAPPTGVVNPATTNAPSVPPGWTRDSTPETFVLPASVPDPIEPVNRFVWGFNKDLMIGVIKPTSKGYRFIVRKPVRTAINNFGRNMTYPDRLINNLLEGKWAGARHETDRFFCNTVIGAAGFFDVATKWKIPKADADFGQTFGQWGWKPKVFLMLPVFGPSNDRDATGLLGDSLANPITYFSPYSYATIGIDYNMLTDSVDEFVRFSRAEMDPYSELEYAWTFVRENKVADFRVKGEQDESSLDTLQLVFFTYQNPEFPDRGKTGSALIPATGRKLKYSFWLQKGRAPVVYIIPGLGSHRLAEPALALAELVYQKGFSVVCVSSAYNSEFMESASTADMPAYTPIDAHDTHVALTEIDHQLQAAYPDRLGARALMGYSMGAFHSLFIAATSGSASTDSLVKFDRIVSINTPVRLLYGISKLDEFYQAPLEWPATERTADIENTFLKVAALSSTSLRPQTSLPFSAVESKFLIGLTFRFILRDIIFTSQLRNNQGVLQNPIKKSRREPVYQEILHYSFKDYFQKFAIPYYKSHGIDLTDPGTLARAADLRTYATGLQANPNIRLLLNRNDFLLADEDYEWLRSTFAPEQMTVFEKGGHLGNLSHPTVQKAILNALEGLRPLDAKAK
ncbi:MAG: VacJ family lipoprotein [Pedosphaera sp.]|nr:VacJ family lipoprotein [Pedosphaera sp.]